MINIARNLYQKSWKGQPVTGRSADVIQLQDGRSIPLMRQMPLLEALQAKHPTDAMLVGYTHPNDSPLPRLSKSALASLSGEKPVLSYALIDVDYEDHEEPFPGWAEIYIDKSVPEDLRESMAWYRTPHGLRLVWELTEPVPIEKADSFLDQLHERIPGTDAGTSDWTRLQRAPLVPRTYGLDLPFDFKALEDGLTLDWMPEKLETQTASPTGEALNVEQPETVPDKLTRKTLKPLEKANPDLAEKLYTGTFNPPVGDRHASLLRAAMSIVYAYETIDPTQPYALLKPSNPKGDKELWRICVWACETYDGIQTEEAEERRTLAELAAESMDLDDIVSVPRRLIVDLGPEKFVWDEEEQTYSFGYTKKDQILTAMDRHCPRLSQSHTYQATSTGMNQALRDLSTVANTKVYSYDPAFKGLDFTNDTFYVPCCQPDPALAPRFDEGVDAWLRALFAGPHLERVLDWLAMTPDLTGPICALYIAGDKSVGKSALAFGIARLWSRAREVLPYRKLNEKHGPAKLLKTPLIYADESAVDSDGRSNTATFREIIGNNSIDIEEKYRASGTLLGYPRLLITANNLDALNIREDLTQTDVEAIQLRVGFVDTRRNTENVLLTLDELAGSGRTHRDVVDPWVQDGLMARHLLWLNQERVVERGDRLLVEGWESEWTRQLPTSVGSVGLIVDAIVEVMLNHDPSQFNSVRFFGGKVYVSNTLLSNEWLSIRPNERMPHDKSRVKALQSLSQEYTVLDGRHGTSKNRNQRRYYEIDAKLIDQMAVQRGTTTKGQILDLAARDSEDIKPVTMRSFAQ